MRRATAARLLRGHRFARLSPILIPRKLRRKCTLQLLFSLVLIAGPAWSGEVLDRLVATVNGHAILASDWDGELRFECFMSGRSLHDLSPEDRRAAFERLIDQELLREQMAIGEFKPASPEKIAEQLENVKTQYSQQHPSEAWDDALSRSGLSEKDIADHVTDELNSLRLVREHLRPSIQVDAAAISDYYSKELLPKLAPDKKVSLQEATPKIREILVQQKMNELLNSWLDSLRSQAQIRIVEPQLSDSAKPQGQQ